MADFNTVDIGGPLGSSVTPQAPVVDQGVSLALADASTLVQGAGQAIYEDRYNRRYKAAADAKSAEELATGKAIGGLTDRLTTIADAVERGDMTPAEAGVRKRAELGTAIGNSPQYAKDIMSAFNAFGSDAGAISAKGNQDQQLYENQYKEAGMAGVFKPWMSPAQKDVAKDNYFQQKVTAAELDATMKQLDKVSKELSIAGARTDNANSALNLQKNRLEVQARQQLQTWSGTQLNSFRDSMKTYVNAAAQPGADKVLIQQQMATEFATVQAVATQAGANAGSDYANSLFTPFKTVYESSKDFASGKIDQETLDRTVETTLQRQSLVVLGDPKALAIAATIKVIPGSALSFSQDINAIAMNVFGKNEQVQNAEGKRTKPADPFSDTEKLPYESYLKSMTAYTKDYNSNRLGGGEPAREQLERHLDRIMEGAKVYGAIAEGPEDMNQLAQFIAEDSFGEYVAKRGKLPGDAATGEAVRSLFQQQYLTQGENVIKEEYLKARL